jgi:exodeoxyribonuclease V alpha subunit
VKDVRGIGFLTADKIAQALGLAHDDPGRIEAGVAHTLSKMANEGHVYVPQEELEPEAAKILGIDQAQVAEIIDSLERSELLKRETISYKTIEEETDAGKLADERAVYLTPFYYSEIGLASRIRELIEHPTSRLMGLRNRIINAPDTLPGWTGGQEKGAELSDHQKEAVKTAIINKVTILTGGPGTGKTTTLRWLLNLLDGGGYSYALASPTGRAAKRMSEATNRPAKTIHRLLEYNPGDGFGRNDDRQLDADMIIIDEASMLDLTLANHLLKATSTDSHLLLVGDIDQLPSVGAGDVLADLIDSGVTAVVRLEFIFRQAAGSLIIQNAHRINQGSMPFTPKDASDFFLFIKQDPEEAANLLVDIVKNRIPRKFGFDPLDDIQVMSPMYQGQAGVTNLNLKLQEQLNPPKDKMERSLGGRAFRVGDKVMQTVNNYDKNVFNGDIGRITSIDTLNQTMGVNIDGSPVIYDFIEVDELIHAFAITVHKSQGSEYRCVVMPVLTQHYLLLQRNLLYTAVTRAQELVILVGTRQAIGIAISNNRVAQRYTALDWRLKS